MAKNKRSKPESWTLTVTERSPSTGKEEVREFKITGELSTAEIRKKVKDAYGVDLSRADVRRLQKLQTVNTKSAFDPYSRDPEA